MATIRRAGERIITKVVDGQRRVSCSCCPSDAECCMYPAAQLGIGYSQDDLPDSVEVFDQTNTYTFTKNGSIYEFSNLSLRAIDGRWAPFADEDEIGDRDQPCLIAPNDTLRVTDFFADTYTVTTYEAFQITRTGLCTWFGLDSNGCETLLEYFGVPQDVIPFTDFPYKWVLSWSAAFDPVQELCGAARVAGPKEGFQNSPVGTYADPLALISATIT
jgi:hypothetical protein